MIPPRELRRRLGPLAWAVLQDLAEDAEMVDGRLVARSSARRLAANLGIGKDTAARALRALGAAGLIAAAAAERGERGWFAAGGYELTASAARSPRLDPPRGELRAPARPTSPSALRGAEQPSLFDAS